MRNSLSLMGPDLMELTDLHSTIVIVCGVAMVVGILGVVVPVVPGLALCWLSVLVWAIFGGAGSGRWTVLVMATLIAAIGAAAKYLLPGRRLKNVGVPNRSIVAGGLLAIVGFFVIPLVGLIVGFVAGIYLAEHARLKQPKPAWESTKHALKATGVSILIELGAAIAIAVTWVSGLIIA